MTQARESSRVEIVFEPPDLLDVRYRGEIQAEDVERYIEARSRHLDQVGYILLLIDVRDIERVSPDAKRRFAQLKDGRATALAFVGAPLRSRMVINLVMSAGRLFGRSAINHRFFDDEREGRAWLAEMRRRFGSSHEASSSWGENDR